MGSLPTSGDDGSETGAEDFLNKILNVVNCTGDPCEDTIAKLGALLTSNKTVHQSDLQLAEQQVEETRKCVDESVKRTNKEYEEALAILTQAISEQHEKLRQAEDQRRKDIEELWRNERSLEEEQGQLNTADIMSTVFIKLEELVRQQKNEMQLQHKTEMQKLAEENRNELLKKQIELDNCVSSLKKITQEKEQLEELHSENNCQLITARESIVRLEIELEEEKKKSMAYKTDMDTVKAFYTILGNSVPSLNLSQGQAVNTTATDPVPSTFGSETPGSIEIIGEPDQSSSTTYVPIPTTAASVASSVPESCCENTEFPSLSPNSSLNIFNDKVHKPLHERNHQNGNTFSVQEELDSQQFLNSIGCNNVVHHQTICNSPFSHEIVVFSKRKYSDVLRASPLSTSTSERDAGTVTSSAAGQSTNELDKLSSNSKEAEAIALTTSVTSHSDPHHNLQVDEHGCQSLIDCHRDSQVGNPEMLRSSKGNRGIAYRKRSFKKSHLKAKGSKGSILMELSSSTSQGTTSILDEISVPSKHGVDHSKATLGFFCLCGQALNNRGYLNFHINLYTKEWKFQCDKCDHRTYTRYRLKKHYEMTHNMPDALKGVIRGCTKCGEMFEKIYDFTEHQRTADSPCAKKKRKKFIITNAVSVESQNSITCAKKRKTKKIVPHGDHFKGTHSKSINKPSLLRLQKLSKHIRQKHKRSAKPSSSSLTSTQLPKSQPVSNKSCPEQESPSVAETNVKHELDRTKNRFKDSDTRRLKRQKDKVHQKIVCKECGMSFQMSKELRIHKVYQCKETVKNVDPSPTSSSRRADGSKTEEQTTSPPQGTQGNTSKAILESSTGSVSSLVPDKNINELAASKQLKPKSQKPPPSQQPAIIQTLKSFLQNVKTTSPKIFNNRIPHVLLDRNASSVGRLQDMAQPTGNTNEESIVVTVTVE